jgi:monoterpene epsilon-lactone hydrolase
MHELLSANAHRRRVSAGLPQPSLDDLRAGYNSSPHARSIPGDVCVERAEIPGIAAYWLIPSGVSAGTTLIFLHGGGYVLGSLASHGELAARIGRATGARVLFIDYRLAPEHAFPAGLDDAIGAWQWLTSLGTDPRTVTLAGDSAGGGLSLALLLALRDAAEPLAAAAALMSPWTDLTLRGESMTSRAEEDNVLTPTQLAWLADQYLAGADPATPAASPLFADLHMLPPMLVQVGSAEILLSDSERLADRLRDHGGSVTLDIAAELPHVYQRAFKTPEAHAATDSIGYFLREILHPPSA